MLTSLLTFFPSLLPIFPCMKPSVLGIVKIILLYFFWFLEYVNRILEVLLATPRKELRKFSPRDMHLLNLSHLIATLKTKLGKRKH